MRWRFGLATRFQLDVHLEGWGAESVVQLVELAELACDSQFERTRSMAELPE